jgi:hypothetical protein
VLTAIGALLAASRPATAQFRNSASGVRVLRVGRRHVGERLAVRDALPAFYEALVTSLARAHAMSDRRDAWPRLVDPNASHF